MSNIVKQGTYDELPDADDASVFIVSGPPDVAGIYFSDGVSWTLQETGGGGSLPVGGTTGQVLTKESNADDDAGWETTAAPTLAEVLAAGNSADGASINAAEDISANGLIANVSVRVGGPSSPGVARFYDGAGGSLRPSISASAVNPTTGAGVGELLGSILMRSNGQAWLKTGAGDTAWTQLGGAPAGAIQVVRVPIAFDTANLVVTGITVYTPAVGDVLLDTSFLSVTTAWDGATPGISLYSNGDVPGSGDEIIQHYGLGTVNPAQGSSTRNSIISATMPSMYLNASGGNHIIFDTTAVLKLMVDDGAGGNPGSTEGAGVFTLIIAPAA